jgi:hypothetical protein
MAQPRIRVGIDTGAEVDKHGNLRIRREVQP